MTNAISRVTCTEGVFRPFVPALFRDTPSRLPLHTFESKSSSRIVKPNQYTVLHAYRSNELRNLEKKLFLVTEVRFARTRAIFKFTVHVCYAHVAIPQM